MKFAIIWDDGFETTFYKYFSDAVTHLRKIKEMYGVGGKIMRTSEYLKLGK